jgi:hypothetical protein
VNASAREKERQVRQLKQYLEAEQQPPQDGYSFPVFGKVNRTLEDVTDAASKLNLDSDKMNAALFWFWKDNEITDEVAFEALKDGDINAAWQIWDKLVVETEADGKRYWKEVTNKNCSAFHNWSIATILNNGNNSLQQAIYANLTFLESDFWQKLKEQVTDNTCKIAKKELQLMFLNSVAAEDKVNAPDLVKIIKDIDFSAKQDFLKSIAQKFIKNIIAQIESAVKQRKESAINAAIAGENLYRQTQADLKQLKEIFDTADFSYSNVADKVANEILQCSIDFFNDCQDKELDNNYHEIAMKLAKWAQDIAVGSMVKDRIKESLQTLKKNIDNTPKFDLWGNPLDDRWEFVKIPKNIGIILGAYSDLVKSEMPLTAKQKSINLLAGFIIGLAIGGLICLIFRPSIVWVIIWFIVPVTIILLLINDTNKFNHMNLFVGNHGFAEYRWEKSRDNIVVDKEVNFNDITDVYVDEIEKIVNSNYSGTDYRYIFLNTDNGNLGIGNGKILYSDKGSYNKKDKIELQPVMLNFCRKIEKICSALLLDTMEKRLANYGYIIFNVYLHEENIYRPYIKLGVGYITFLHGKEKEFTYLLNDIKKVYFEEAVLYIEHNDFQKHLFRKPSGNKDCIPMLLLCNKLLFYIAMEKLVGYKII